MVFLQRARTKLRDWAADPPDAGCRRRVVQALPTASQDISGGPHLLCNLAVHRHVHRLRIRRRQLSRSRVQSARLFRARALLRTLWQSKTNPNVRLPRAIACRWSFPGFETSPNRFMHKWAYVKTWVGLQIVRSCRKSLLHRPRGASIDITVCATCGDLVGLTSAGSRTPVESVPTVQSLPGECAPGRGYDITAVGQPGTLARPNAFRPPSASGRVQAREEQAGRLLCAGDSVQLYREYVRGDIAQTAAASTVCDLRSRGFRTQNHNKPDPRICIRRSTSPVRWRMCGLRGYYS